MYILGYKTVLKVYFNFKWMTEIQFKGGRWRDEKGRFISKEELADHLGYEGDLTILKTDYHWHPNQIIWFNEVVKPFADEHGLTFEEALRKIEDLRESQILLESDIEYIQSYQDLYSGVYG